MTAEPFIFVCRHIEQPAADRSAHRRRNADDDRRGKPAATAGESTRQLTFIRQETEIADARKMTAQDAAGAAKREAGKVFTNNGAKPGTEAHSALYNDRPESRAAALQDMAAGTRHTRDFNCIYVHKTLAIQKQFDIIGIGKGQNTGGGTMYKAKNGIIINDSMTPAGFNIESDADIITALLYYPVFQTVATGFITEALQQAKFDRREYDDIKDLAQHLLSNYI